MATLTPPVLLDTADEIARWLRHQHPGINARTIRKWAARGHITRHPGDRYDGTEIADYLDHRTTADTQRARACAQPRQLGR